jgi:hypothetical protein
MPIKNRIMIIDILKKYIVETLLLLYYFLIDESKVRATGKHLQITLHLAKHNNEINKHQ